MEILEKILLAEKSAQDLKKQAHEQKIEIINNAKAKAETMISQLQEDNKQQIKKLHLQTEQILETMKVNFQKELLVIDKKMQVSSQKNWDKCLNIVLDWIVKS